MSITSNAASKDHIQRNNFGSRYLHLSNVWLRKDMQTSAYFILRHRARSSQGAGAVAHMSLHLIYNVKDLPTKTADSHQSPIFQPGLRRP